MVWVMRARCNTCQKNYTVTSSTKPNFKEGEGIGVMCGERNKSNCAEILVFMRLQGTREPIEGDFQIDGQNNTSDEG